jgi:hypothetical protein
MTRTRLIACAALMLSSSLAFAEALPQAAIDRTITLPRGTIEPILHGTYANWGGGATGGSNTITGETLSLGFDYGVDDRAQVGFGVALPVNPGAGFGSILLSAAYAFDPRTALRVDAGFENFGANGDNTGNSSHTNRYFGGLGARIKIPLSPTLAFVSGRTGAIRLGHFTNLGSNGTGLYIGASFFSEDGADNLLVSAGNNSSNTAVGINLPAGLLLQPDPRLALTLQAGYSAMIVLPVTSAFTGARTSTRVEHFIPVGLEVVFSPAPQVDIGGNFIMDGFAGESGGNNTTTPGFFDIRTLMLWIRFRGHL